MDEQAVATSQTDPRDPLPDDVLGRMIVGLQAVTTRSRRIPGQWYSGLVYTRVFSDTEIGHALHLTARRVKRLGDEYRAAARARRWDEPKIVTAVFNWAVKNKRWPRSSDWDQWQTNGLGVARQTMSRWTDPNSIISEIIENDRRFKKLTPSMILSIPNVTTRREAVEKYGGNDKLIRKVGTKLQEDEFGAIWETPAGPETPDKVARYVQVTNSTAEPDGTFGVYFLRVPPTTETAKEAVEWSFDMELPDGFLVET